MKLQIQDPENELTREFALWLIERIKFYFESEVDPKKLIQWDTYLNKLDQIQSLTSKPVSSERILHFGIESLTARKIPKQLDIIFANNKFVPGLDRVNLYTICKLITFGNQEISGYPILLTTLQHFADNINFYVNLYEEEITQKWPLDFTMKRC